MWKILSVLIALITDNTGDRKPGGNHTAGHLKFQVRKEFIPVASPGVCPSAYKCA